MSVNQKPVQAFTPEEERQILAVVATKMTDQDREPSEVIKGSPYRGDKQRWLVDMVRQHGIELRRPLA